MNIHYLKHWSFLNYSLSSPFNALSSRTYSCSPVILYQITNISLSPPLYYCSYIPMSMRSTLLASINKKMQNLSSYTWLISLNIIPFKLNHFAASGRISFFLWLNNKYSVENFLPLPFYTESFSGRAKIQK